MNGSCCRKEENILSDLTINSKAIASAYSTQNNTSNATRTANTTDATGKTRTSASSELSMDSFLQLIVAQMQNQDPMNPTSQDTYMTQLAQLAMVQSINDMAQTSVITYAASLSGKEVTVANITSDNKIEEVVGTVTGVGFYNGEPILYVDGKAYSMSQLIAVGKLPELPEEGGEGGTDTGDGEDGGTETPEETKSV